MNCYLVCNFYKEYVLVCLVYIRLLYRCFILGKIIKCLIYLKKIYIFGVWWFYIYDVVRLKKDNNYFVY